MWCKYAAGGKEKSQPNVHLKTDSHLRNPREDLPAEKCSLLLCKNTTFSLGYCWLEGKSTHTHKQSFLEIVDSEWAGKIEYSMNMNTFPLRAYLNALKWLSLQQNGREKSIQCFPLLIFALRKLVQNWIATV